MIPRRYITALILLSLLATCVPVLTNASISTNMTEERTPTPADTATSSIQLTQESCLANGGKVEQHNIESPYYDQGVTFRVYTPPCYGDFPEEKYPVLYLIHGQGFDDEQWDRIGADEAADVLIGAGEVAPFIIVMPYDNYSLRPSVGFFDEAFLEQLIPWIDSHYRALTDRQHRAVGGLSRGASWAIHFALSEPDLFGAMGGHSPPVFIEEAKKVVEWLDAIPAERMPRFWLDIGDQDTENIIHSAEFFEGLLSERNIAHEWHIYPGDHDEKYWSAHVEEYLRWYAEPW